MAPDPLEPTPQPPCAGLLEPMLTDAVIEPHTEEAGAYKDVDPRERPRYDALIPTQSLRLNTVDSSGSDSA